MLSTFIANFIVIVMTPEIQSCAFILAHHHQHHRDDRRCRCRCRCHHMVLDMRMLFFGVFDGLTD